MTNLVDRSNVLWWSRDVETGWDAQVITPSTAHTRLIAAVVRDFAWSVFALQWPCVAFAALIGRE